MARYRYSAKEDSEVQEEGVERLVRPNTTHKPPRYDRRRNVVHEGDPDFKDLQDDVGAENDKDLSLNYKTVGGSADKTGVYHGIPVNSIKPYDKTVPMSAGDYTEDHKSEILKASRKYLKSKYLMGAWEGVPKDVRYRAALDMTLRTLEGGRYENVINGLRYMDLLDSLMGSSTE